MYGLMRAGICSRQTDKALRRRLHYCGTCKTMGLLYGHKSRVLLNNDAVFLGELLTLLMPDSPDLPSWSSSLQSYNCFALPKGEREAPLPLQIAATVNVVVAEFKVADQRDDRGGAKWTLIQRVYSDSFLAAARRMKEWGFPLESMWGCYQTQRSRESDVEESDWQRGAIETLEYVAEPTATVTGWTFQHAAHTVGAKDAGQTMYSLGFAFGQLVYMLDAWDDYARDIELGEFNALRAAFERNTPQAPDTRRLRQNPPERAPRMLRSKLHELVFEVVAALHALPLPLGQADMFAERLRTNLRRRLDPRPPGKPSSVPLHVRLIATIRQILRRPTFLPAYALPLGYAGGSVVHRSDDNLEGGDSGPGELAAAAGDDLAGKPALPRSGGRSGGGGDSGCDCGGCGGSDCDCGDCCCTGCTQGGCECCGEGCCEGVCGACSGSCGICGSS